MQLLKYEGDSHSIISYKQKEGETVREYFVRFMNATLDIPEHDVGLIVGNFMWGLLLGPLSQKLMGKKPQMRFDLKEKVEQHHQHAYHLESRGGSKYFGRERCPQGHLKPLPRDEKRRWRPDVYVVSDRQVGKGAKGFYKEYHKITTHDTINFFVLKWEMEGKQLKGNLIDIARSLRSKFDIENANDDVKANDRPQEIMAIRAKRGRPGEDSGM